MHICFSLSSRWLEADRGQLRDYSNQCCKTLPTGSWKAYMARMRGSKIFTWQRHLLERRLFRTWSDKAFTLRMVMMNSKQISSIACSSELIFLTSHFALNGSVGETPCNKSITWRRAKGNFMTKVVLFTSTVSYLAIIPCSAPINHDAISQLFQFKEALLWKCDRAHIHILRVTHSQPVWRLTSLSCFGIAGHFSYIPSSHYRDSLWTLAQGGAQIHSRWLKFQRKVRWWSPLALLRWLKPCQSNYISLSYHETSYG